MQLEKIQEITTKFDQIEKKLQDPEVINIPQELQKLSQEHAELQPLANVAKKIERLLIERDTLEDSITKELENDIKEMYEEEIISISSKLKQLKKEFNKLNKETDPNDKRNVIMEIRAGTGGEEAALFAADLFRMYTKFAENQGWRVQILNSNITGNGGFKEIVAHIEGDRVYGKLKYESGVHRVQRVPSTESSGRIHTSAASVVFLPEVDDIPEVQVKDEDIKIDVYRATGPGGQSVNTTDSAVRITHTPTNIVVTCQDEKSQHKNKARALSILKSKLYEIQQEELASKTDNKRKQAIKTGDRSAKIRTYNFPQGRVTDHRIKESWYNLDEILDGKLDDIMTITSNRLTEQE